MRILDDKWLNGVFGVDQGSEKANTLFTLMCNRRCRIVSLVFGVGLDAMLV